MMSTARCWKQRLAALAIVTSLLSGCATVGSEPGIATACPPVVEYKANERDITLRVTDEI
ncbi:hypothetical protein SAMN04488094_102140 [Tropicimonas isoalkanivorans]|uniref:Uncharacterized protein n=1 Tax=Tropicimonas isoalkanivorans TaxID=441112 RepID=A0A1I1FMW5_9RHOB|nr:hypothetical protein SAMN04488094_102140 [Tropicimonas isoalkanivorans]